MESKITIHTGEDHKPVIKVIEKDSDDVRDNLVSNFRHLLSYESSTFTVQFNDIPRYDPNEKGLGIKASYYIKPVENERAYCLSKLAQDDHEDEKIWDKFRVTIILKDAQKNDKGKWNFRRWNTIMEADSNKIEFKARNHFHALKSLDNLDEILSISIDEI